MKFKLVGIGELLWDLLPEGRRLGGAPANFAYHASALGADARIISRVGSDAFGREILEHLSALGLPTNCIEVDGKAPTGTVTVQLRDGQPSYTIHEPVAWDYLEADALALETVAEADAICFGTLAQRSETARSAIRALVQATPSDTLRILDVNLRQSYFSAQLIEESLALANVLKLNDAELPDLAEKLHLTGDVRSQLAQLAQNYELRLIAYTRGEHGSLLFSEGYFSEHHGIDATVVDTVGAGDSFTASMTLGLLAGWSLDKINQVANEVAAHVCSCSGATPALPPPLQRLFQFGEAKAANHVCAAQTSFRIQLSKPCPSPLQNIFNWKLVATAFPLHGGESSHPVLGDSIGLPRPRAWSGCRASVSPSRLRENIPACEGSRIQAGRA